MVVVLATALAVKATVLAQLGGHPLLLPHGELAVTTTRSISSVKPSRSTGTGPQSIWRSGKRSSRHGGPMKRFRT